MRPRFGFPLQLALFAIGWCVGLEILVRLLLTSPSNIIPDTQLGSFYAPNSSALIETPDAGPREVSFNELGLNDGPIQPKGDRARILVLGDSYVEALQLPRRQNFLGVMAHDEP